MKITRENTACLVVDYQEKLMPIIAERKELVKNSVKLLKGLRALGVPMMITGQYTKGLGLNIPEIFEAVGTEEYVDKLTFSCYQCPKVQEFLEHRPENTAENPGGKNQFILICGIETHICTLQTAIDLAEAGYTPVFVVDCLSSRDLKNKEVALMRAQQGGVLLTTSESILFELLEKSGTDVFKEISRLVK